MAKQPVANLQFMEKLALVSLIDLDIESHQTLKHLHHTDFMGCNPSFYPKKSGVSGSHG